jgi:glucose/arabinose dehydrogenase
MLYIGLGDGGAGGDPLGNGQKTDTLLGKLLRIDVSTLPYTIPAGNISTGNLCGQGLPGSGPCSEIWDHGLRNPYRFSFDACSGDVYIGDVGQGAWEEIDIAAAGDGNKNWGWRLKEGDHCFNPATNCDPQNITTAPAAEYNHNAGKCSVTGGYVYRGSNIPWLRGAYIYGDYCTGDTWMLRWANGQATDPVNLTVDLESKGLRISSFGQDARGEIYLIHYFGGIFRIDAE